MTELETLLTGANGVCDTMDASVVGSDVLVLDNDREEDGFDEDGLEAEAAVY